MIKRLREQKRYHAWEFLTEIPNKGWTKKSINKLLLTLRKYGTVLQSTGVSAVCNALSALMKTSLNIVLYCIYCIYHQPHTRKII